MKSGKRIKNYQARRPYPDGMDTTIIKFANVMTSGGDITYFVEPVVSDIGGYNVTIKDTPIKNQKIDEIDSWFNDQYDRHKPLDIIIVHEKLTYKYNLDEVVKHIKKFEFSVSSEFPCCACDDCDCCPTGQIDFTYNHRFLIETGIRAILLKINSAGIRAHKQKELDGKECPVLMEPLIAGHTFQLPCNHYISRRAWLKQNGQLCPLCRYDARDGRIQRM